MYDWDIEIKAECKEHQKRWNGKTITTSRQWTENAGGALEPVTSSFERIYDAVRDYYDTRDWN